MIFTEIVFENGPAMSFEGIWSLQKAIAHFQPIGKIVREVKLVVMDMKGIIDDDSIL